jgi:hypothetical protein
MAKKTFSAFGGGGGAKSQVASLSDVAKAINFVNDAVKDLNIEQKKNNAVIKEATTRNDELSRLITKEVEPAFSGVTKKIEKLKAIQNTYNKAVNESTKKLLNQTSIVLRTTEAIKAKQAEIEKATIAGNDAIVATATKAKENLEKQLQEHKEYLKDITEEYSIVVDEFNRNNEKAIKSTMEVVQKAEKVFNESMQNADDVFKKMSSKDYVRNSSDQLEVLEKTLIGVNEHLGDLTKMSSLGDLGRSAQSAGGTIKKIGDNLVAASGGSSMLGRGLSMLGGGVTKMMGPLGAVIGIVETLMGAEKEQKDFNKSIMEGGGALDFMAKEGDNLHQNLNTLRQSMYNFRNLSDMGMSPEEVNSTLKGLQDANITLKEMGPAGANIKTQFEGARNIMMELKTISTVFGVGIEEVTSHVEVLHQNLGKAVDDASEMREIKNAFDNIRDAATQAGYSNKKFFSTIISVTNEVGNMNGRISEAGALFVKLKKLMGKKGEKIFEAAKEGYEGKSVQERYTEIAKVGSGKTKRILQREAETKMQALFKEKGGIYGGDQASKLSKITGIDIDALGRGDKSAVQALGKLDPKRMSLILREIQTTEGLGADVANTIQDLITVSRGAVGDIGQQMRGIEKMSMGGNLAMLVNKLGFLGMSAEDLADVNLDSAVNQQLFADAFGENASAMRDMIDRARGEFASYTGIAKEYAAAVKSGDEAKAKKLQEQLEKEGLKADERGNLLALGTGKKIEDMTSFIQSMPERFKALDEMAKGQKTQEELLQESIEATVATSDILSQVLKDYLDPIWTATTGIFDWIRGKDPTMGNKLKQEKALEEEAKEKQLKSKQYTTKIKELEKLDARGKLSKEDAEKLAVYKKAEQSLIRDAERTKMAEKTLKRSSTSIDEGTLKNMSRFEQANKLYLEEGGDFKALAKVKDEYDEWAVEEIKERERIEKSGTDDEKKILSEIESGKHGGSAFELKKAKELAIIEDEIEQKRGSIISGNARFLRGEITLEQAQNHEKLMQNAIGWEEGKKKNLEGITFNIGEGYVKAAEEIEAKEEKDKAIAEVDKKILEEQKKIDIEVLSDKKIVESNAVAAFEATRQTNKKYSGEEKKEAIAIQKEAQIGAWEEKEKAETTASAEALQKLFELKGEKYEIGKIENALISRKLAKMYGVETGLSLSDELKGVTPPAVPPTSVTSSDDMILSDKGAFKLNSKDDILAMKPGGAIDQFLKGGGGGGRGNVTININGGDEARIFEVVKKAMSSAGVVTQGIR